MQHTEQEKRFLEKLGITHGPWKLDKSKNYIYADKAICDLKSSGADGELITKAIEIFLSLFHACNYYYAFLQEDEDLEFFDWILNPLLLAQKKCKTFEQLLKIWETCK